jgi:hypothetical protein
VSDPYRINVPPPEPDPIARAAQEARDACDHAAVMPVFDEVAAHGMSAWDVRRHWPRFMGQCPRCRGRVILYASFMAASRRAV